MVAILRFSYNNSIYLERVLAIASPEALERHDDRNGIHYACTFPGDRLADLFLALDYAKNWESTIIEVQGRTLVPKQLREVMACYHGCLKAKTRRISVAAPASTVSFPAGRSASMNPTSMVGSGMAGWNRAL